MDVGHALYPCAGSIMTTLLFVLRLERFLVLSDDDLRSLWQLIEADLRVPNRDLVVDDFEYRKFCFVKDVLASRYKLLHNGKRQIANPVLPGNVVGLPGSFLEKTCYSVIAASDNEAAGMLDQ
jgi:hypothetical protein